MPVRTRDSSRRPVQWGRACGLWPALGAPADRSVAGDDRDPARRHRPQGGCPPAAPQQRHFTEDRARPDLGDHLAVHLDGQDTIKQQEQLVTWLALLDQGLARPQPPEWGVGADDQPRQLTLQGALDRGHDGRRLLLTARAVLRGGLQVPLVEVDQPGLGRQPTGVVVDPVTRKRAGPTTANKVRSSRHGFVNLASPPLSTWAIAKPAAAGMTTASVRKAGEASQLFQAVV
jgi:hypothetical protein